jgi:enterochelin esterase-like enzyme
MSRGGYWALEIAFRFPEQFVSVGGHSAALYDTAAGPELNPQFTGLTNDLGDLRIYFDIGEDDYLIPNIQRLHEDMLEAKRPHDWLLNEGSHEDAYWALHSGEYLLWYSEPWPFFPSAYPTCQ